MSSFEETIQKLKDEIASHVAILKANDSWAQVEKLYRALGTIEELETTPRTPLAELFGFTSTLSVASVRPGEFIGMEPTAAAKLYLEKKKNEAASLDEIIDAIQKGGAQPPNRDDLKLSLARSTWDVVKAPGQELYTLAKYVPHLKRGPKKKSAAAPDTPPTNGNEKGEDAGGANGQEEGNGG